MWLFVLGFILAGVGIIPAFLLLRWRYAARQGVERQRFEELGKLTGGLAHEIKNPLSTIKVNLKLISESLDGLGADSARYLRKIQVASKETERLEQILEDFLRYIGKTELHMSAVNINDLIDEMVDFYSPQASSHSVTIRVGLSKERLVCKIDADMVKQVILNLFINATQAMPDGGELIVKTELARKKAVIEITDTGDGIAADKFDKIFDAYYTSKQHGSGLGLPIARKIVEAHNGAITVNSQLGKGTSFNIILHILTESQ